MKFSLAFLVALVLSGAVNVRSTPLRHSDELTEVFQQFVNLLPVEDIGTVFSEYLEKDAEVQAVIKYIQSDAFKELVVKVEKIEDVINFYNYVQESGLDIYGAVNGLHEIIGLPPLVPGRLARKVRITGGVAGLIADVKALLPVEEIKALYHEKLETSPAFAKLVERFRSPRFQELINSLRANVEFQHILNFAKEHGVDVKAITDLLNNMLGLEFPSRNSRFTRGLNEDLQDFLALVPLEEAQKIVMQYVEEDAEVQAVIEYAQSDAFKNLVQRVESIEDVINFYKYVQESGLDIYGAVNALHEGIGLPPLVPGRLARKVRNTGGVAGLIADIKALLPLEDIKALYHKKLETSPAFAKLVERLSSPRFQELINALRANADFQYILSYAKEHGVDVKAVTDLLSTMFGLEFPSKHSRAARDLNEDLQDFVALVPLEEAQKIVMQYVEEDPEVQAVIEYAQSDAFKNLVQRVESIEDVINFYKYVQESGLDIYGAVNALHEGIGLPPLVPGRLARKVRNTGGVAGLIADIKALLPLEDIKALYHKKLETSPAFAKLVERLSSPRFQELINALRTNADFQYILSYAKEHGVDVKAVTDLLNTMFGLEFPSRNSRFTRGLNEDLQDFLALVPLEEAQKIVMQYVEEDAEVQAVIEYAQSDAFKNLVQRVESIEDVINFYKYVQESGLDIYGAVNALHEGIGLPPLVPGRLARKVRNTGGVAGLIADIKALLPLEDIKALYHKKLETSPAFAKLVERLSSPRFQELINALRANADFQYILSYAKEHGVDVKAVTDLLNTMFGLEFPSRHSRAARDLNEDLQDFLALVPLEEAQKIVMQYVEEDPEVQAVIEYAQSDAFKNLVQRVESIEDVINFYKYVQESGLDIYGAVNALHEGIGLPPLVPGRLARKVRNTGGVAGLIADIKALLPLEDIKALYHKKLETSPAFAKLVERLSSPRFQELINALRANADFQYILSYAKEHGVDVKAVTDLLSTMFGLEFPSKHSRAARDLNEDLQDFVALVPLEEAQKIVMQYVEEDPEVQAVIEYAQSDAFKNLVQRVESIEDVINFYKYVQESGLDIYGAVNALHEGIGLPPLVPGRLARKVRNTGGVAGLIADIKALLPLEDIKALYHKKLETSPAFAKLVERLSSPRFQELINALRTNADFQYILSYAKEHGVDVKAVTDLLNTMFGLEFPSRNSRFTRGLNEDLQDFLALVPLEEAQKIVMQYVEEDAEVQAVIEYAQSDAFKNLVQRVESIEDVINFYKYVQESGLDIYGAVNALHEGIGLPPLVPGRLARKVRNTGGVAGLIADIKALLPLEDIKALYHKKLETSPAFAKLVERLSSPRFQELINALRANADFQYILSYAKEHGVDVKAVTDLLNTMFGLEFPSRHSRAARDLNEDLQDFLALVPLEEAQKIVMQYVEEDPEVQAVIEYAQSDAFKNLVQRVESIEDVINFYKYVQESGLDIYGAVNALHEGIGLPPLVPGRLARKVRNTGGVAGLIADIKALLPLEDIKALYHKKLETSPAFAKLVERLSSPRFQELINALRANADFQYILSYAKEHGVDVKAVTDLLSTMFGLEFPSRHSRAARDLNEDLQDFLALVPLEEAQKIVMQYVEEDAEVQAVIEYAQSDAFKNLVQRVDSIEDVINFYKYVQESGLDIYGAVNALHEGIGLPPLVPGRLARKVRITGGVAGLIADIKALLPLEDIKALYHKKLETSPAFAKLVERLSSPRFQELINALRANADFQYILSYAKEHGVDVKAVTDLLSTMFGLEFPSRHSRAARDLNEDLQDFLALVPLEEAQKIVMQYVEEDAEVQAVIEYAQSDAFKNLVQRVDSIEDVINFYKYVQESGLDIYGAVNALHEGIGLPPLVPGRLARKVRITGGVAGLIADIKALLPLEDIKALYHKKLETSPAFAKLVERLSSPRFQELINALRANADFQYILSYAKEHGVDVKAVTDLLSTMFGLKFPKAMTTAVARNDLNDDLQDFLALLPVDDITAIVLDYLENDAEIVETMEYLQSQDFHNVVVEVEAMQEARDVLAFLEESGLDAYAFLNSIHEILGIPPFQPYAISTKRMFKATGGLAGLIADVKAILPLDKIKALYYYKLENSPAFLKLIKRLSSEEFQKFVDAVLEKDEARVIINKLKERGVNIEEIADLVTEILGLHFPVLDDRARHLLNRHSEELVKDLADFMEILPLEQISDLAIYYTFNDLEVQAAVIYIASDEFKKVATPAQQNREFRRFIHYLDSTGLPTSFYLNMLNEYLGLPEVVPSPLKRSMRAGGGVRGMLDEIEAILPHKEIKALFEYKKVNSKAFAYMVERLEAEEFQVIIDELALNEDFRALGMQAASHGIDLDAITEFLSKVFGVEIPNPTVQRFARSLDSDVQEFVDLLPQKAIRRIAVRYYLFDKEFKAAVVYAKSDEFAQLIRDLHEVPEYNDLLKSLENAGLDVQTTIAKIHKQIGFEGFRFSRQDRKTHGIAGFVAEVKAVLPVADIKALYNHKLETSEEFVGLVELISSDKFQAVTDALFANTIFQDILHRLQARGIDLKVVSEFFLAIFGITTPPGVIDFFAH